MIQELYLMALAMTKLELIIHSNLNYIRMMPILGVFLTLPAL